MFSRFFSPLKSSNAGFFRNMFKFSTENSPLKNTKETNPSELTKAAEGESKVAQKNIYTYDPIRFKQVNNEAFVKKIEEIERFNKYGDKRKADGYKLPIFLTLAAAFIYHCWVTIPYNVVYK